MIDYKAKPFYLNDEDIAWAEKTLSEMTLDEKVGQLFCITDRTKNPDELKKIIDTYHPGGFMFRAGDEKEIRNAISSMQQNSRIPMLMSCNLESGGNGASGNGTFYARPLAIAATDDDREAFNLGMVCAREGGAIGFNWSFAPIVDIDYNFKNPITNVRTYGSDPERVVKMGRAYIEGIRSTGTDMAVCIKHFPGDGVDERDQHLLPTLNSLSCDRWESTYGKIYKTLIEEGAETVMVGHILQPEMTRKFCKNIRDIDINPGSTNKYIITDLLRGQLGFNGLVTTDATPMVGYTGIHTRREAIVLSLNAGADVILFTKDTREDITGLKEDILNGKVSMERVEDAIRHQLALKAKMKLHRKKENGTITPDISLLKYVGCDEHQKLAAACADKSVTLVKDNQHLLPLSSLKTKRIRLTVLGENEKGGFGDNSGITSVLREALTREGFEVSLYDYATMENDEIYASGVEDMKKKFDLSIVAANVQTGSNNTTRRVNWITLMAANEPWYTREIPTMFISFCNPYHLFDVPFISTYINAYSSNRYAVEKTVEKMVGKSEFLGKSPVDPFCNNTWGAREM